MRTLFKLIFIDCIWLPDLDSNQGPADYQRGLNTDILNLAQKFTD